MNGDFFTESDRRSEEFDPFRSIRGTIAGLTAFVLITSLCAGSTMVYACGFFVIGLMWATLGVVVWLDRKEERRARKEASRNGGRSEER